jgi:hypothetical protein
LCKEFGILTIIDGTHAPGQIPLDLRTLDADFHTGKTNCYGNSINTKKDRQEDNTDESNTTQNPT